VRGVKLVPVLAVVAFLWPAGASANPQHAGIQVALRAHGLYLGPIDGQVGPRTVAAIRAFQHKVHLHVTGIADVRTRLAMGPLGRPLFGERTLHAGDFGLDVAVLQFLLTKRGLYFGALDGYMGPQTRAALRRYQKRMRLLSDGVAGPRTRAALVLQNDVPVRAKPTTIAATAAATTTYRVRAGDTLTAIARRYSTTVAALARANKLDPSKPILIGARLRVPREAVSQASRSALAAAPTAVRDTLDRWAVQLGVNQRLVRALAWMESGFQPHIVSSAGARGVLQTLPSTRDFVETVLVGRTLPTTLDGDVQVGVLFLRHLLRRFDGDEDLALAAWYQGEGAVRRDGVYGVTRPFVANVLALKQRM
jgi:peptidoglycan hydrolase-like protein with peptidoglycan-binding domain